MRCERCGREIANTELWQLAADPNAPPTWSMRVLCWDCREHPPDTVGTAGAAPAPETPAVAPAAPDNAAPQTPPTATELPDSADPADPATEEAESGSGPPPA